MSEDLAIGDGTGNGVTILVQQNGWDAEDVGSGSTCVDFLDGVTDATGDAVCVKGTPLGRSLCKVAGCHGDGIVTALAVARKLDAFTVVEEVDVA